MALGPVEAHSQKRAGLEHILVAVEKEKWLAEQEKKKGSGAK